MVYKVMKSEQLNTLSCIVTILRQRVIAGACSSPLSISVSSVTTFSFKNDCIEGLAETMIKATNRQTAKRPLTIMKDFAFVFNIFTS